jgi:hypothetical protein
MSVLSAGAVQRGLEGTADAFQQETGERISLTFATAPVIRDKVENQKLIERFGIGEAVKEKTTRLADAGAVMEFLARSKIAKAIGFV